MLQWLKLLRKFGWDECFFVFGMHRNLWGNLRKLPILDLFCFWAFLFRGIETFHQELLYRVDFLKIKYHFCHWITLINWKLEIVFLVKSLIPWTSIQQVLSNQICHIIDNTVLHTTRQRIKMWKMKTLCITTVWIITFFCRRISS